MPQQADHKKGTVERARRSDDLPDEVKGGLLNPDFVETLLGLPIGWSHPDTCALERNDPGRWPAPRGAEQYPWEPPRTTAHKHLRRKRLKALGNVCVPQHVLPIFLAIKEFDSEAA